MNPILSCITVACALGGLAAQTVAVFPSEYSNVAEGPLSSQNLPLANGTSRVLVVYDGTDVSIPAGAQILKVGFRQDGSVTQTDTGRSLQLEIRMGYTANNSANLASSFDANYAAPPVTVFGPALFVLPNLRDAANPLPQGRFFIPLTTPFTYTPANGNLVVEYRILGNSVGGASFTYRLDRADFYSPVTAGPAGCPHSGGGTPVLNADATRVGGTYTASLSSGPPNSLALLVVGAGAPLASPFSLQPLVPGIAAACQGQVQPAGAVSLTAFTSTSGTANYSFSVPNNPALNDLFLSSQCALFDFFAPGGVVVSNGMQVQIGIRPRSSILSAQGPPATLTTGSVSGNFAPVAFFEYQ